MSTYFYCLSIIIYRNSICLSFRSVAEESAFAVAAALRLLLPLILPLLLAAALRLLLPLVLPLLLAAALRLLLPLLLPLPLPLLLGKPSLQAWPSPRAHRSEGFSPWSMLSFPTPQKPCQAPAPVQIPPTNRLQTTKRTSLHGR